MGEVTKFTENIYQIVLPTPFPVGPINVYVIKGDALTLVDTGPKTDEALHALKIGLKEIGYSITDIDQVLLTHHHPDHVGLLDYFSEDMKIIGHWRNEPWISKDESFFKHVDDYFLQFGSHLGIGEYVQGYMKQVKQTNAFSCKRSLTGTIKEGDIVDGLRDWKIYETPGHAQSHIVLHRESDGIMLGGDHIIAHISSNPILEPPYPGETERPKPQLQYNASLKKCYDLDIDYCLSGHGRRVISIQSLLDRRFERQHERAFHIHGWLKEEAMTAFEICKKLFPAVWEREMALTLSETVAQLDYLESLNALKIDKSKTKWIYSA